MTRKKRKKAEKKLIFLSREKSIPGSKLRQGKKKVGAGGGPS